MEFVEGEDLAQHIQRNGKFSIEEGLNAIEQAAAALKAACAKSIIHRDIKPSNLMLTRDGIVKVSDLGLAKILTENTEVTATGVGMGSPHFIAPEQADDSRSVDHRVDIYALGITLLYILTGKKPFDGSSPFSVVLAHANKPLPSGVELGTELPEAVEGLIRRMAAKKPDERYQDYDTLIADIQRVRLGAAPVQAAPVSATFSSYETGVTSPRTATTIVEVPSRGMHPALLSGIVGVLAALVVLGGFIMFNRGKKEAAPSVTQLPATGVQPDVASQTDFDQRQPPDGGGESDGPPGPEVSISKHIARILPPPPEVTNPLADGPVETMFQEAENYAAQNPENFFDILAHFDQVAEKGKGSPIGVKAREATRQWSAKRTEAFEAAIKKFKAEMDELEKNYGHREAMDHLRTFPPQLRSAEADIRIFQELAVPPPGQQRGGERRGPPRANQ